MSFNRKSRHSLLVVCFILVLFVFVVLLVFEVFKMSLERRCCTLVFILWNSLFLYFVDGCYRKMWVFVGVLFAGACYKNKLISLGVLGDLNRVCIQDVSFE